jgi:hypothetical protein
MKAKVLFVIRNPVVQLWREEDGHIEVRPPASLDNPLQAQTR